MTLGEGPRKTKAPERRREGRPGGVTIRDIAREAGVSTATVSRAFNAPETVKPATREAVMAVARQRHYVPQASATTLASQRSRLLGVIIPTISNSIYAQSTQAVQQAAQEAGYTVIVGVSDFSPEREERLIHRFIEHRVEGLVLTGEARAEGVYDKIEWNDLPFVVTWKYVTKPARPSVSFDNFKAAASAVEHLLTLGHRRIGFVCGRSDVNDRALGRRRAFEETMRANQVPADPDLIFERDFEYVEGTAVMRRMLEHRDPPTAVFCANDIQAIGAMAYCHQVGLSVPRDMSIVGFDDLPITQYTTPQLTTVHVPAAEMGRRAAQQLLGAIRHHETQMSFELPTHLIVRGSTMPPTERARRPDSAVV